MSHVHMADYSMCAQCASIVIENMHVDVQLANVFMQCASSTTKPQVGLGMLVTAAYP